MSDAAPKDWAEAIPSILFGTFGFAFGFEAVVAMNEGHWGLFFANMAACLGCASIAILWGRYRSSLPTYVTNKLRNIANSPVSLFAIFLVLWIIPMYQVASLRSDLDNYAMPRTITTSQAKALREANTAPPKQPIIVRVNARDQEAMEYASRLFNVLLQANWSAKFEPINFESELVKVQLNAEHIEPLNRTLQSPLPFNNGLCIHAAVNLDTDSLKQVFTAADIQVYCGGGGRQDDPNIYVLVGVRPVGITRGPSLIYQIAEWVKRKWG